MVVTTAPRNGRTEAQIALPVPAAPDGSEWTLTAQIGGGPATDVRATIHKPGIEAELSCGQVCALHAGDSVGLDIVTSAEIAPLEALVTTRLDGVPQLVDVKVPLVPRADGTAQALLGLTAPGAGSWKVDVTVAGYAASSIVTTVQ
jgi:hypothetical protein